MLAPTAAGAQCDTSARFLAHESNRNAAASIASKAPVPALPPSPVAASLRQQQQPAARFGLQGSTFMTGRCNHPAAGEAPIYAVPSVVPLLSALPSSFICAWTNSGCSRNLEKYCRSDGRWSVCEISLVSLTEPTTFTDRRGGWLASPNGRGARWVLLAPRYSAAPKIVVDW